MRLRRGAAAVFVLGEPGYYGRLGFEEACPLGWRCVYAVPAAAFRVQRLGDRSGLPPPEQCAIIRNSTHSSRAVWRRPLWRRSALAL